jgi:hypothetical protein
MLGATWGGGQNHTGRRLGKALLPGVWEGGQAANWGGGVESWAGYAVPSLFLFAIFFSGRDMPVICFVREGSSGRTNHLTTSNHLI